MSNWQHSGTPKALLVESCETLKFTVVRKSTGFLRKLNNNKSMNNNTSQQATGASQTTRFFCTQISSAAGVAGELKQQHKKEPNMANKNTDPGIGKLADPEVMNKERDKEKGKSPV